MKIYLFSFLLISSLIAQSFGQSLGSENKDHDMWDSSYSSISSYPVPSLERASLLEVSLNWVSSTTSLSTPNSSISLENGQSIMVTIENPFFCTNLPKAGFNNGHKIVYEAKFSFSGPHILSYTQSDHYNFEANQNPVRFNFTASQVNATVVTFQVVRHDTYWYFNGMGISSQDSKIVASYPLSITVQ